MNRPQKVVAYIVKDGRIVVLRHADLAWDETGLQVPAGTVKPGELPGHAVLREASEETGLGGLRIVQYLGTGEYDMRPYAEATHARHCFHLTTDSKDLPERWEAHEDNDGVGERIRFELYWVPLEKAHVIGAGQGAFLGRVVDDSAAT